MDNETSQIKVEHIELVDRLILVLTSYQKFMKADIAKWNELKCRELDLVNNDLDNLMDSLFSIAEE